MSVPTVPEAVRERIRSSLSAFEANEDRAGFVSGRPSHRTGLPGDVHSQPPVLRFLLQSVLGFGNLGRYEKTAWEYTFSFRGVQAALADQKMGVYLYLDRGGLRDEAAARGMRRLVVSTFAERSASSLTDS